MGAGGGGGVEEVKNLLFFVRRKCTAFKGSYHTETTNH